MQPAQRLGRRSLMSQLLMTGDTYMDSSRVEQCVSEPADAGPPNSRPDVG
jgi:hypothetical protein